MPSSRAEGAPPVVTGIGVASGFGYGKQVLRTGLHAGADVFGVLARPGRQPAGAATPFIGVEMPDPPDVLPKRIARTAGLSGRVAVAVLGEAWTEAGLADVDPARIGLVVGGSNLQNREAVLALTAHGEGRAILSPHLGYSFFDTDICGLCCAAFPIRGFSLTVGGASASGAVAVLQAAEAVRSGRVDACIALGALQDLSHVDLAALQALGALGPRHAQAEAAPGAACRPFDRGRDGFVFGEACAALVLRRADDLPAGAAAYGSIVGGAHRADGHRGPDPSLEGELRAIRLALADAGIGPDAIDYVNAHGTGTPLGDDTEAAALLEAGLATARINATKSILGHGIAAAGAIEVAATLLQMRDGRLHPTRNLKTPIVPQLGWVGETSERLEVRHALSLSFGFGGIDTALVLRAPGA
ncbi:beta-ketoacyl synthase N-terminal-like domain-containing protein [Azorhizobium doebereinerae]|uniref:beta-ketoacyl synthase N-terminal-like domain-containing protein n=1 Tax=Azorhizobium doebereinerae TaxID=281091 RepID=UPI0004013B4B|nr:beta-ketoacyl synthase N-terminal-like domain-containing protein [Azorhizobium doebereinerae]